MFVVAYILYVVLFFTLLYWSETIENELLKHLVVLCCCMMLMGVIFGLIFVLPLLTF